MGRTRTRTAAGIVFDAGALIALDRGDKRLLRLTTQKHRLTRSGTNSRQGFSSAGWRRRTSLARWPCSAHRTPRHPHKFQKPCCGVRCARGYWRGCISAVLSNEVETVPLDDQLARSCGEPCAPTNLPDVIDASVVILARERRDPIVTSDPNDLRRLDPAAQIIAI